ncbi:MAG: hypothetical protein KAG93_01000, partial [Desulfuromusa sp.]|nr:hypothetical protein [Desulfuromusa sp.]
TKQLRVLIVGFNQKNILRFSWCSWRLGGKVDCFGFSLRLSTSASLHLKKSFLSFYFKHIDKKTGEDYDKGVGCLYHLPGDPGGAA